MAISDRMGESKEDEVATETLNAGMEGVRTTGEGEAGGEVERGGEEEPEPTDEVTERMDLW